MAKLKYERYNNSNNILLIDLHNGYSVISLSGYNNEKELYDTDWMNYHNAVGYKISDTEQFATKFSDTLLGTLTNSKSDTSNFTNILADATSVLMNELYGAAEQYYTNMAAAMEAAGTTTGTFADDLATNVD